jgi:diaminohydroxyphosphoribosylaminopyrimidine deaminase/5-amino-6-(5-phosphoribosylamino)uracil reductase
VTLKAAVSLDGRIATASGQSKWITGTEARQRGHLLREEHDAILVGVGTVLADDPHLDRHLELDPERVWRRIVLDSKLRSPASAKVVCRTPEQTILVHTQEAPPERKRRLADAGVQLLEVDAEPSGLVHLPSLLHSLAEQNVTAILVEGGAMVHGSFVDADLVDEAVFFVAPLIIGGAAPPAVAGEGVKALEMAPRLRFESVTRHGDDLEIQAIRQEEDDVHRAD